jgi:small-conductance mechanosensitive channel
MNRAILLTLLLGLVPAAHALNGGLAAPPPTVDRRTPLATVDGFLTHAQARDHAAAAHYLNLQPVAPEKQVEEGARLARRLHFVLNRKLWFDYSTLSPSPEGHPEDGADLEHLGEVAFGMGTQPVRLERATVGGEGAWVFSSDTVRAIDRLYDLHGAPLGERLPDFMFSRPLWILEVWQYLGLLVVLGAGLLLSWLLQRVVLRGVARLAKLTSFAWDDALVEAAQRPLKYLFLPLMLAAGTRFLQFPPPAQALIDVLARFVAIAAVAWFVLRFVQRGAALILARLTEDAGTDPGRVRGMQTQVTVLRRVAEVAVVVVGASMMLMQFEVVRSVGVSLLASAGLAGLVIGLAAQRSISTLLAGIQLSITQPIRIGDTVIVENEWGWIEEVTLTYVVVKVWDLRRLVIPMTYFLERPFQNWSKVSPDILGTIELRMDFTADVDAFRRELDRILASDEGKKLWDGKVNGIQVVDCTDRVMTLRPLVSASDAGKAWDLRCLVRERLLAFMATHPEWMPVTRYGGHGTPDRPLHPAETAAPARNKVASTA